MLQYFVFCSCLHVLVVFKSVTFPILVLFKWDLNTFTVWQIPLIREVVGFVYRINICNLILQCSWKKENWQCPPWDQPRWTCYMGTKKRSEVLVRYRHAELSLWSSDLSASIEICILLQRRGKYMNLCHTFCPKQKWNTLIKQNKIIEN